MDLVIVAQGNLERRPSGKDDFRDMGPLSILISENSQNREYTHRILDTFSLTRVADIRNTYSLYFVYVHSFALLGGTSLYAHLTSLKPVDTRVWS